MRNVSDHPTLAGELAARNDDDLADLLTRRHISPQVEWSDFFDAADGLLDPASVDRALTSLPRAVLVVLGSGSLDPIRDQLDRLGLVRHDGLLFDTVADQVAVLRRDHPDAFEPLPASENEEPATTSEAVHAAEHALSATATLTDLLLVTRDEPLSTTRAGGLDVASRRRLEDERITIDADDSGDVVATAVAAGLARVRDQQLRITTDGESWLGEGTLERWRGVVEALAATVPDGLRVNGQLSAPHTWEALYPLREGWPADAAALRARWARWGLLIDAHEPTWARTLRERNTAPISELADLLPAEVDRVYVQADLSIVAPGRLRADLEARLRSLTARESRAQASTYRITPESLGAAIASGLSAADIRGFLTDISLSGLPQPVEYLITQTEARHGTVRVGADPATGQTVITSPDPHVLDAMAVDSALRGAALTRGRVGLETALAHDAMYWMLVDARYPAMIVDEHGNSVPLRRIPPVSVDDAPAGRGYAPLIARMRENQPDDAGSAWRTRELDRAVRSRALIDVTVRLPDGSERTFALKATGIGGGRLRGDDAASEVERTLPISSIVSVATAGHDDV